MIRVRSLSVLAILAILAIAACGEPPVMPIVSADGRSLAAIAGEESYVIVGANETLPQDLSAQVHAAGGVLVASYPEIGVATARAASSKFRDRIASVAGVESVSPDMVVQWVEPTQRFASQVNATRSGAGGKAGNDETYFSFQWAPKAIEAPEAWNAGYMGAGVRVAIVDGGIYSKHVDLAPNFDVAASRSFVPGFAYNQDIGTFWHGTHVAGIVAAADNGIGTIGIAPKATLIGVKVVQGTSGTFESIIRGIMYAAKPRDEDGAGADIINLSLGATLNKNAEGVKQLKKAVDRATNYANRHGVTLIAAVGNDETNFDEHEELIVIPAQSAHVIAVSATGPHGWALGATNFSRPTYYTNYGTSLVDVAAPGGTDGLFVVDGVDETCTVKGRFRTVTQFCEIFDYIISTSRGSTSTGAWAWSFGTSMAAPMVSGVAALIIQRNGGHMQPDEVRERLEQTAIDLGKKGVDEFFGHGWVNARRAVR